MLGTTTGQIGEHWEIYQARRRASKAELRLDSLKLAGRNDRRAWSDFRGIAQDDSVVRPVRSELQRSASARRPWDEA